MLAYTTDQAGHTNAILFMALGMMMGMMLGIEKRMNAGSGGWGLSMGWNW